MGEYQHYDHSKTPANHKEVNLKPMYMFPVGVGPDVQGSVSDLYQPRMDMEFGTTKP